MNNMYDFFSRLREASQNLSYQQARQARRKGGHPSGNLLYEYVLDKLDEKSVEAIEEHLAFCGVCADELLLIMGTEAALSAKAELQANSIEHLPVLQSPELFYWEPYDIGLMSTAAESPKQTHLFSSIEGTVMLTCDWGAPQGSDPAYIWVAWKATISKKHILELSFLDPETGGLRHKAILGNSLVGEETFTSHELNFDPSHDRWAVAMAIEVLPS